MYVSKNIRIYNDPFAREYYASIRDRTNHYYRFSDIKIGNPETINNRFKKKFNVS